MELAKTFLQYRELAGRGGEAFDRAEVGAVDLHREDDAGSCRFAVDLDGAGAAHAVVAADMGAGGAEAVAQGVVQQGARFDFDGDGAAVEGEADLVAAVGGQERHSIACCMTARPTRRTSSRR